VSRSWRTSRARRSAERTEWPDGSTAALSLSFDDARASQLSRGTKLFDRLEVHATFFVLPRLVRRDVRGWRAMVQRGHEIGNHSLHHPCTTNLGSADRTALEQLTIADIGADLVEANRQIDELLGVTPRAFAYPCGQTYVGRGVGTQSYVPVVARMFRVGRTFRDDWANEPTRCDLAQVAAVSSDRRSFEALRPLLDDTLARGAWLVLGGHEIGTGDHQVTFPETIEAVVSWCRREGVRIGTIGAIGEAVATMQEPASDQRPAGSIASLP
jgi:peptidoglycan/xylan/chitin deacetylase (PgdA/CDA1 family)